MKYISNLKKKNKAGENMKECKEIFRLKEMLEKENIPFIFNELEEMEGYQIGYPYYPSKKYWCSIIQHKYSYGNEANLLEIWESSNNDVEGNLTAEDIYKRISRHYKEHK